MPKIVNFPAIDTSTHRIILEKCRQGNEDVLKYKELSKQDTDEAISGKILRYLAQTMEDEKYYLFHEIKEDIYQETDYLTILPTNQTIPQPP